MESKANFVVDSKIQDKGYPALARWQAQPYTQGWRQFGQHWPWTVPVELHEHCHTHHWPFELYTPEDYPDASYYTIGLGFFDFNIDYLALVPETITQALIARRLRLLFYYHEGDDPKKIQTRLDSLCWAHNLNTDCYRFISGNTAADELDRFAWFPDHELLYWHRNRDQPATPIAEGPRSKKFTALNRTHKWWRATAMADLWRDGLLDHSQWSYRTDVDCGDRQEDNPIEIDSLPGLRLSIDRFLKGTPYTCDDTDTQEQNDHHRVDHQHWTDSYCSIILETHFDADGSDGSFLTEKTFKAIKHGHPFVIVGCPGTLRCLRDLGYRTFDHAIDNSYDDIKHNTDRWQAVKHTIRCLADQDLHRWFESVRSDVEHNQRLFSGTKWDRLNTLFKKLEKS